MTTTLTRIQLVAFALVTLLAVGYGAVTFFHIGSVFSPPYLVKAEFTGSGGIYPRADVDLLGTRVGTVRQIIPGPGTGTTVVLALDNGVRIPRDVRAIVGDKSAIGEQYVELEPQSSGGPVLADGDVIGTSRTAIPINVADLLQHLDALAGSIPTNDLSTVTGELATAFDGVGGTLGHLIDNSDRLTRTSLAGVADLNSLIDQARTVLDTQVAEGPRTAAYLKSVGALTAELRRSNPAFASLFGNGVRAGAEVSNLLADNAEALPVLLNRLVSVTTVATDRIPALRKTLVLFPWSLELGATGIRRCGSMDAKTGKPVQATCRYDAQGRPIYSTYLAAQLPEGPTDPPYFTCTRGYEGTVKYYPNGQPVSGHGPAEQRDSPPNYNAHCAAPPTDPRTPLVRGAQNVTDPATGAARTGEGLTIYDPTGLTGLGWLLTSPLSGD